MRTNFITPTSVQSRTISELSYNPKPPKRKKKLPGEGYEINKATVKKRVWMLFLMNNISNNLYFLTITFPKQINDDTAYKCFNSFLTNARTHLKLKDYIWIAERQSNSTIHYHIFILQYLQIQKVNKAMKSTLTTAYRNGELTAEQWKSVQRYSGAHLSKDKNGKVINLRRIKDKNKRKAIVNYIAKYVTKSDDKNDQIHTRLAWFSSRRVSAIKSSYKIELKDTIDQLLKGNYISENYFYDTVPGLIIYPLKDIPIGVVEFDHYIWTEEQRFLGNF